jgi:hypothetical protein
MTPETKRCEAVRLLCSSLLTATQSRPRREQLSKPVSKIARGTAHRLPAHRSKTGTRELGVPAQLGAGLAATAGDGHCRGRSFRSSQRAGKPCTRRREAGRRGVCTTGERSVDTDHRAAEAWVLNVQRKLYQWSKANPDDAWREMWNWVTDIRNLRHAWRRVASNKGRRSAGIDRMTVACVQAKIGEQRFLERLRSDLRSGAYRPSPSRRKLIPKPGKPGKFRPLGIPIWPS